MFAWGLCAMLLASIVSGEHSVPPSFLSPHAGPIMDQGRCGSCYTFSSARVLQDRRNRQVGNSATALSPQIAVSCSQLGGCAGGSPSNVLSWYASQSVASACGNNEYLSGQCTEGSQCEPSKGVYGSGTCQCPVCSGSVGQLELPDNGASGCQYGADPQAHFYADDIVEYWADSSSGQLPSDYWVWTSQKGSRTHGPADIVPIIQHQVLDVGPVSACFELTDNFYEFYRNTPKGIFTALDVGWDRVGGHCVTIVGWGTASVGELLIDYWHVANSWGADWGDNGYFRIQRGKNVATIESRQVSWANWSHTPTQRWSSRRGSFDLSGGDMFGGQGGGAYRELDTTSTRGARVLTELQKIYPDENPQVLKVEAQVVRGANVRVQSRHQVGATTVVKETNMHQPVGLDLYSVTSSKVLQKQDNPSSSSSSRDPAWTTVVAIVAPVVVVVGVVGLVVWHRRRTLYQKHAVGSGDLYVPLQENTRQDEGTLQTMSQDHDADKVDP